MYPTHSVLLFRYLRTCCTVSLVCKARVIYFLYDDRSSLLLFRWPPEYTVAFPYTLLVEFLVCITTICCVVRAFFFFLIILIGSTYFLYPIFKTILLAQEYFLVVLNSSGQWATCSTHHSLDRNAKSLLLDFNIRLLDKIICPSTIFVCAQ